MSLPGMDVIRVYKRIVAAVDHRRGVRLTYEEAHAITCDGAVMQAIDTADYEDSLTGDKL